MKAEKASDDILQSPVNRAFLAHWRGLCAAAGGLPTRDALDPVTIPSDVLPHIFIGELWAEPFSVRLRLQGTYITEKAGQSLVGRTIDVESFGPGAAKILDIYRAVWKDARPYVSVENQTGADGWGIRAEVLHVPLLARSSEEDAPIGYVCGTLDRIDSWMLDGRDGAPESWSIERLMVLAG